MVKKVQAPPSARLRFIKYSCELRGERVHLSSAEGIAQLMAIIMAGQILK
jgi:hypothetical protein